VRHLVGHFLSPVLPSGIRFRTSSEIKAVQKAVAEDIFLRSISMDSVLDILMMMRYTNLRFIIIIIIIILALQRSS